MRQPDIVGVSELHLHLEGSLSAASAIDLAKARSHPWGLLSERDLKRQFRYSSFVHFLRTIREMCMVLSTPAALERAAYELGVFLHACGIGYAEVYTSPYIYVRWGVASCEALLAVDRGFERAEAEGYASCSILLDSVRQFGVEPAQIVLSEFERCGARRVVGFGIGGEESISLKDFAAVYARARDLGLGTVVHTGETCFSDDIRIAAEVLQVDRIAHGIHVVDDPALLREIVARGIAFDVSVTSNYRTQCITRRRHPVRTMLDHGAIVTLSTDDPSLFRTTLADEYRRAKTFGDVSDAELLHIARNGIDCSFAGNERKRLLHTMLDARV